MEAPGSAREAGCYDRRVIRRQQLPILAIYAIYVLSLAMTTALLVFWVAVVQRFNTEINELVSRLGVRWNHYHLFVQSFGALFFFLVIVSLTFLLGLTLSERRASRQQRELLSNVTHELKSPLAAIRLHAQTLQQDPDIAGDDDSGRSLSYILRESERVEKLVDNLLEGSRLQAGKVAGELQPIALHEFFHDYQEGVRNRFDLGQIDLRFEIRTRSVVLATNDALQRIMDNLIDNAMRFTQAGGRILCEVRDDREGAEIVVADTGVGIPKRELGRVFERFYTSRRQARDHRGGTGLGLAIVRGLVEEMRGRIRAISEQEEQGARFEIRLPKVENEDRES